MTLFKTLEEYVEYIRGLSLSQLEDIALHLDKEIQPERYQAVLNLISERRHESGRERELVRSLLSGSDSSTGKDVTIEEYVESVRGVSLVHLEWMVNHVDKEKYPERCRAIVDAIEEKRHQAIREEKIDAESPVLRKTKLFSGIYLAFAIIRLLALLSKLIKGDSGTGEMALSTLIDVLLYLGYKHRSKWVLLPVLVGFTGGILELTIGKYSVGGAEGAIMAIIVSLKALFYGYQLYFLTRKETREVFGFKGNLFSLEPVHDLARVSRPAKSWPLPDLIFALMLAAGSVIVPYLNLFESRPWSGFQVVLVLLLVVNGVLLSYSVLIFWKRKAWPAFRFPAHSRPLIRSLKLVLYAVLIELAVGGITFLVTTLFKTKPEVEGFALWATSTPYSIWIGLMLIFIFSSSRSGYLSHRLFFSPSSSFTTGNGS